MKKLLILIILASSFLAACSTESDWARRDMPTAGLDYLVTYNLTGPAGTEKEINEALFRGVNQNGPRRGLQTVFGRMSGSKTQDVLITQPDGAQWIALGMTKTKRFAGLTHYLSLEPATYWGQDAAGRVFCGVKVRLDFNRNFIQYFDRDKRDFQSLWYYDVPCELAETAPYAAPQPILHIDQGRLRALVLNEVWQARVAAGSFFFNWGHSVTIKDGLPAAIRPGWWEHWDLVGSGSDTMQVYDLLNELVIDITTSDQPWLKFNDSGQFKDSWVLYSAGDADQYATFDRIFMNRQREYAVFYRPDREATWDYVTIQPVYNYEWNDVHQNLWAVKSWADSPESFEFYERVGDQVQLRSAISAQEQIKEIERIGWMNAPNASLEQIRWTHSDEVAYAMTVRAHIAAADTLVIFGEAVPSFGLRSEVQVTDNQPQPPPILDEKGQPVDTQPWNSSRWSDWLREASFWNFILDNPEAVRADLLMQYRFTDNTQWVEVRCTDSDGNSYVCRYDPVEWDLSTSYYTDGDPRRSWLILQTLGEVGVRTLGLSYASGLYEGTGVEFALDQQVFYQKYFNGLQQEDIFLFDARALQLPETLAQAWEELLK